MNRGVPIDHLDEEIARGGVRAAQVAGFDHYEGESLRRGQVTQGEHQLTQMWGG